MDKLWSHALKYCNVKILYMWAKSHGDFIYYHYVHAFLQINKLS